FFFFSSRRRHTRSKRDWSSDVCSSDLEVMRTRELAAAASSRVLITSPSLVLDFAPKAKDARTRASWGQSGADPPQPSPHTDLPRSSRQNGAAIRNLCLPTLKGLTVDPGIPPGHGLCPERSRQNAERNDVCYLPTAFCLLARASRAVTADRESTNSILDA